MRISDWSSDVCSSDLVGNMSQKWARALLDVEVAYGTDIDQAKQVIKDVADQRWRDPAWAGKVLEEPEIWGVEAVAVTGIVIRLVIKTKPAEQWAMMRELRKRLKAAFDAEGIEITMRSEERGVGKAGVSRCRSGGSTYRSNKKKQIDKEQRK